MQARVMHSLMRPATLIASYFAAIFLGGALIAPIVYHLVQNLAEVLPALGGLARQPFHRYVDRSFMVIGILGLVPALRGLGIKNWAGAGLTPFSEGKREAWRGFLFGFLSLALAIVVVIGAGGRGFRAGQTAASLAGHLFNATLAAVLVAFVEELFFRGVVFGALRKQFSWKTALLVSSAVYAILHFLARVQAPPEVTWLSGLALLPHKLRGFGDVQQLVPAFFNLLLAGIMLGLAYQRTGNLWFSFGLHAGWIFWLKTYGFTTDNLPNTQTWIWGSARLIDGWVAGVVLALLLALLAKMLPKSPPRNEGNSPSNGEQGSTAL
jgi:membrane protease YdiL (CAAX protease family)